MSIDARSAALPTLPEHIEQLKRQGVDVRVLYLRSELGRAAAALLRDAAAPSARGRRPHARRGDREGAHHARRHRAPRQPGRHERAAAPRAAELDPRSPRHRQRRAVAALRVVLVQGRPAARRRLGARLPHAAQPALRPAASPFHRARRPVIEYLKRDPQVCRYLDDVEALLKRWLPEIARENRSHVSVALGCTGGRHRSVYLAEELAKRFRGDWRVLVRHRKLAQENPS